MLVQNFFIQKGVRSMLEKRGKMLRITMNKSAGGAKKYYCEQYYKEGESAQLEYYSEKEQLIGKWGGMGAEKLGLSKDISNKDFASLCDNINPLTSKKLTPRNDSDRTVGYDFTFNASKSVSLAYAFGNEEEKKIILDSFQSSVRETMREIESGMQARVRAKGKNENRITGNIAYGEFTHFTTRPIDGIPDPHLHSHCFVFNATYDQEEKKWKAGQFQQLKQDAPYYEAVFHSKLAHNLQNAGYKIERTKNGFELSGVEKETIEKFSRRTKEIEDYTREHNIKDEKQKSQIGAKTRESKRQAVSAASQETQWFKRLTSEELTSILSLNQQKKESPEKEVVKNVVQYALDHHLERKSVASDKEILATAIKQSIGKATPEDVQKAFRENHDILSANEKLRTFITTKDALKEEKQLIARCISSRNKYRPINEHYEIQNPLLNDQQKAAVHHTLSSTDGIAIITGKAGTGKTTLMKEVQQGILASGKRIYSFAPSSEASRGVQRSEGFDNADTVAKLIADKQLHSELKHQIIWVDEAGMLSNRDMNSLLTIADSQSARIILSGDTKQHTSVERGDALRVIQQETGIKPVTVSKIQRQRNNEYKEAVQFLGDGQTEKGFQKLDQIGAIREIPDNRERVQAVANDYLQTAYKGGTEPQKDVLVVSPTHAEGGLVTQEIRQQLKDRQLIGQQDRNYLSLRNRQLTEAEKQQAENYQSGDVLVFHQHGKGGIKAGNKLSVHEASENGLYAKDGKGIDYNIAFSEAKKFTVYEPKELQVAEGDKLRITANGQSNEGKHLFNGTTHYIEGFDKSGNIKLSNGSTISQDFGHINLGYVSTSHASQGKTADKVIISQSSATFRASSMEQFYVSASRGREAVSIYTDDKEHLRQSVSNSSERTSATELMTKQRQQQEETNRQNAYKAMQEPAKNIQKPQPVNIKNDGLSTKARTEQEAIAR